MTWQYTDISRMIDHALLKPTLTAAELDAGCRMAQTYETASVCIMPFAVARCAELLDGSSVVPCTTIGFPHGASTTRDKVHQTQTALDDGCREIDMVVNISWVVSGCWSHVASEIAAVTDLVHAADGRVKVIFETCYLNTDQKIRLCELCSEIQVDWVKTSTGFGPGGATIDDVRLMTSRVSGQVQVKASGGIRTLEDLLTMRELGATRVGTSSTQGILTEARRRLHLPPVSCDGPTSGQADY